MDVNHQIEVNHRTLRWWDSLLQRASSAPITFGVCFAAIAFYLFPTITSVLEFSTTGTLAPWRLLGCHALHWTGEHLFWDVIMFATFGYLCEAQSRSRLLTVLLTSALTIPIVVAATTPEVQSYRGLSGLDTALFSLFATSLAISGWQRRDWVLQIIGAGGIGLVLAKTVLEVATGATLFVSDSSFTPLPISHLVGIVVGCAVASFEVMYLNRRSAYPGAEHKFSATENERND